MIYIFIISGLIALYLGAELLVHRSSHLAGLLGVSPLIIGLTIVAYGTSTPELVVNIIASISGNTDIALGNVVGSNIVNILFILGLSALVCPLVVHKQIIRNDVPIMIIASLMVWGAAAILGRMNLWFGGLLLFLIVIYTAFLIFQAKKNTNGEKEFQAEYEVKEKFSSRILIKDIGLIIVSLIILVIGSQLLVNGSVSLANQLGISELVISLTIVAAGTGFPELATSVVAAMHGKRDIAVGNIIGSNIYNIFAILGVSAVLAPEGIPVPLSAASFDIPVMVAVSLACVPIFITGYVINRWEGALFIFYYLVYLSHVIMTATGHSWLGDFEDAMLFFFLPLTVLAVLMSWLAYIKPTNRPAG